MFFDFLSDMTALDWIAILVCLGIAALFVVLDKTWFK